MARILVVDDEQKIVDMVSHFLANEGFLVEGANDGHEAFKKLDSFKPNLIVLDVLMSPINGIDILKKIRQDTEIPVIMLTAKAEEIDKLIGLELGADDYITKPFSLRELTARIRVVLRRSLDRPLPSRVLSFEHLLLDPERMEVFCDDELIVLTPTEFKILENLMSQPGRVFTRLQLLESLGETYIGYERTLDTHVSHLRKKIEKDQTKPSLIQTVYGIGYKLESGKR